MRKKSHFGVGLVLCALALGLSAQPLEFKGFELGSVMTSCPPGSVKRESDAISFNCRLVGEQTVAGRPVNAISLEIVEERLVAVIAHPKTAADRYHISDAIEAKYGHATEYIGIGFATIWRFGPWSIAVINEGPVAFSDQGAARRAAQARAAAKDKGDL